MQKILSIIVPGYNISTTLDCLIKSIVSDNNMLNAVEIIIVNDGSLDDTLKIANRYKEKYPEIIKVCDKENGGHGSTINVGIKYMSGKYLQIIDGDDWVEKENFSDFVEYLSNIDVDLILSPYRAYYEDTKKTEIVNVNYDKGTIKCNTVYKFDEICDKLETIGMVSIVFKGDLFKKNSILIDEGIFYDDNEFVAYPIPFIDTVVFYNKAIYVYRLGQANQSMAAVNRWKRRSDLIKVMHSLIDFYNYQNHISESKKKYLTRYISRCIDNVYEVYFSYGEKGENARKEMIQFDSYLKNESMILYSNTSKKRVKIARFFHFHFYDFFVK